MPPSKDQALCLRQMDWSETSQVVWLLARDLGLVRALAKGARRPGERFDGGIELLTRGEAIVYLKPGAELATLAAWDTLERFPLPRRSLDGFYAGLYLADLVLRLLQDRDPHPRLFDALAGALRAEAKAVLRALLAAQWMVLDECGYRPKLDADLETGGPLLDSGLSFLPRRGGFSRRPSQAEPAWRVRPQTVAVLRNLDTPGPDAAPPTAMDQVRAARLLDAYAREILGRDIPAGEPLFARLGSHPKTGNGRS